MCFLSPKPHSFVRRIKHQQSANFIYIFIFFFGLLLLFLQWPWMFFMSEITDFAWLSRVIAHQLASAIIIATRTNKPELAVSSALSTEADLIWHSHLPDEVLDEAINGDQRSIVKKDFWLQHGKCSWHFALVAWTVAQTTFAAWVCQAC